MGAGVSQEQIQAHLARQEVLIRQLQAVVEKQAKALEKMGKGIDYDASKPGHGKDPDDGLTSEVNGLAARAKAAEKRKIEVPVTPGELSKPSAEWKTPTEEEERGFMAVKPWLGAMAPPDGFKYGVTDAKPDITLQLEYVYGYRANSVRDNVFFVDQDTIIYFAAAVGIVHKLTPNTQQFLLGHTDDILSMAYHPARKIIVTGEQGKTPAICVWDLTTCKQLARLAGFHKRGVVSVSFSDDGSRVCSVGLDDDHSIAVYDWANGALMCSSKGDSQRILSLTYNHTKEADSNNMFVTTGVKHIAFWTQNGGSLDKDKGLLGNLGEQQPFLSVGFTTLFTCVGTQGGEIYVFKGNKLQKIVDAHQQAIYSVIGQGDTLYTGGRDGYVNIWNMNSMKKTNSFNMNKEEVPEVLQTSTNSVKALDILDGEYILAGCITGTINKIRVSDGSVTTVVKSHYGNLGAKDDYGELWGLATAPQGKQFVTAGEDSTLRVWDVASRKMVSKVMLRSPGVCAAWSPNGQYLAVGLDNGSVCLYDAKTMDEIKSVKKAKRRVQSLRFSPDSSKLAAGTADNVVEVLNTQLQSLYKCTGNSSVILHVDFSDDGKYLQSCSQAYELLFYNTEDGKQHVKSRELNNVKWATFSSILGWNVQGIWPAEADGSDVNAVMTSHSQKYLASAEDSGLVKIFNYPCVGGGLDKTGKLTRRPDSQIGRGHSSHVTNVDWVDDDSYLISTGGGDLSIFQWKVVKA